MKLPLLFALVLGIAPAFAEEPTPSSFSVISSYLSEPSGHNDIHGKSGGCTDYVLPAEVAKLITTRTINELLAALIFDADSVNPSYASRIADLVIVVLAHDRHLPACARSRRSGQRMNRYQAGVPLP